MSKVTWILSGRARLQNRHSDARVYTFHHCCMREKANNVNLPQEPVILFLVTENRMLTSKLVTYGLSVSC